MGEFEFMDLLYSRYTSPLELMSLYIDSGRFGEFVAQVISMDNKRKQEAAERENEERLWEMYLHSFPEKSFADWKDEVLCTNDRPQTQRPKTYAMTDKEVSETLERTRNILKGFQV